MNGARWGDLNTFIASPTFAVWWQGQDLDVVRWMMPVDGKTPAPHPASPPTKRPADSRPTLTAPA